MQVTGVQAVGARGIGTLQPTVSDTRQPATGRTTGGDHDGGGAPRATEPEPVAFPRDGVPVDRRPVHLRQLRAAARYREDGGEHDDRREGHRPR